MTFDLREHAKTNNDLFRACVQALDTDEQVAASNMRWRLDCALMTITGLCTEIGYALTGLVCVQNSDGDYVITARCCDHFVTVTLVSDYPDVVGFRRSDGTERTHPFAGRFGIESEIVWLLHKAYAPAILLHDFKRSQVELSS